MLAGAVGRLCVAPLRTSGCSAVAHKAKRPRFARHGHTRSKRSKSTGVLPCGQGLTSIVLSRSRSHFAEAKRSLTARTAHTHIIYVCTQLCGERRTVAVRADKDGNRRAFQPAARKVCSSEISSSAMPEAAGSRLGVMFAVLCLLEEQRTPPRQASTKTFLWRYTVIILEATKKVNPVI